MEFEIEDSEISEYFAFINKGKIIVK